MQQAFGTGGMGRWSPARPGSRRARTWGLGVAALPVDGQHVLCDLHVALSHTFVLDDEDEVEPREHRRLELDVVLQRREVVVAAARGVGGCKHARARLQHRRDARLGDRDRLLLHRLHFQSPCRTQFLAHDAQALCASDHVPSVRHSQPAPAAAPSGIGVCVIDQRTGGCGCADRNGGEAHCKARAQKY